MGMSASNLDRKIQFLRYVQGEPDGFGGFEGSTWENHGTPVWAHRADVSDGEKFTAAQIQATITSRFTVRSSAFTRDINPVDRIMHNGQDFNITGVKESKEGRLQFIEITASARSDGA